MFKALFLAAVFSLGSAHAAEPTESIVGVGMVLSQSQSGKIVVESLVKNSPAEHSGMIRAGDELLEVQALPELPWVKVTGTTIDSVVSLIRGQEGTLVGLQLQPVDGSGNKTISLKREKITIED